MEVAASGAQPMYIGNAWILLLHMLPGLPTVISTTRTRQLVPRQSGSLGWQHIDAWEETLHKDTRTKS